MKYLYRIALAAFFCMAAQYEATLAAESTQIVEENDQTRQQTTVRAPQQVVVTYKAGMESVDVTLKTGDILQLRFDENPSTGYGWGFQVLDADYLELVGDEFFVPESDPALVGQPGLRVYTLKAIDSGRTLVKVSYYRPWEGLQKRIAKCEVNVTIEKTEETDE